MSPEINERRSWYRWLTDVTSPWGAPTATIRLHFVYCDRLASIAYRIMDRLKSRYVDYRITTSTDFGDAQLEGVDIVFVLIDKDWADCLQANAPPGSFRRQIQQSLAAVQIAVVPMLIGQAEMPLDSELGEDLALLADRNAIRVDPGRSFEDDVNTLIDGINFYYRKSPVRWANAPGAGVLARIGRFADIVVPVTVPPEYSRSAGWVYLGASLFTGLVGIVMIVPAIADQDYCLLFCSFIFLLAFLRVAPFAIREAIARPYFKGEPEIFLSYRRADTIGMAGRIYDRLRDYFGVQRIFMDVGGCIPIGADFRNYLDQQIRASYVVILLIGTDWLGLQQAGAARIFGVRDFVRIEVECALASGKPVLLVLMNREKPPEGHEMPTSLRPILDLPHHVVHVGNSFDADMDQLTTTLNKALKLSRPGWHQWLIQMWLKPNGIYAGMPWWVRALIAGVPTIAFVALSMSWPLGWIELSQDDGGWVWPLSIACAMVALWCSGQIVGALRQKWSGNAG